MLVSSQILWLSSLPSKQPFWGSILWRSDLISWKPVAVVVQWPSYVWLFVTPWTAASQASLSLTISQSLPKFMFIASVMSFSHLILWRPPLLLPSVFPNIGVFSTESGISIRWPKYWRQNKREKRVSEVEMGGLHHWCNEHELGQTLGDGEGQGGLVCCSSWTLRVGHN